MNLTVFTVNYSIVNNSDNSSKKAVFDEDEEDKYKERNSENSLKRKESGGGGKSTLEELIREEEKKKEKINRKDYWLHEEIIVKVMNKALAEKGYYKQKGVVRRICLNTVALAFKNNTTH